MSNYLIHACPSRMWYVEEYLVPSIRIQGIKNISIKCDNNIICNPEFCMSIFKNMPNNDDGTWHLQDDVIICRDFKKLTEQNDFGIVCGFTATSTTKIGFVDAQHMWWSFPCIRIPNKIANECAEWYYFHSFDNSIGDDEVFRRFIIEQYPNIQVLNLKPNLVDHIDYLIGGSVVNKQRGSQIRAQYFKDTNLVNNLANKLKLKKLEKL